MCLREKLVLDHIFWKNKRTARLKYYTVVYVFILVTWNPRSESPSSVYVISQLWEYHNSSNNYKIVNAARTFHIPISLLAFAEAGYRMVVLFPILGSSIAKTFPVAENIKSLTSHLLKTSFNLYTIILHTN